MLGVCGCALAVGGPPIGRLARGARIPQLNAERSPIASVSMPSRLRSLSSLMTSVLTHLLVLLLLAMVSMHAPKLARLPSLVVTRDTDDSPELPVEIGPQLNTDSEQLLTDSNSFASEQLSTAESELVGPDSLEVDSRAAAAQVIETSVVGLEKAITGDLLREVGLSGAAELEGRGAAARAALVAQNGGSEASERAVATALRWLALHQHSDGSWNFDLRVGPCGGQCRHAGTLNRCTTGATGLALLPFLGAGQTPFQGEYQKTVERGLDYLRNRIQIDRKAKMGSLVEGAGLYDHGIATIALCEAYAMTHDNQLREAAELAVRFIVRAQDPVGGGWRYVPGQPGDTSQVGWQLMALKSAHLGYLRVPPETVAGATRFLDALATEGGSVYGYRRPGVSASHATTAVGLLCRMYLGWERSHPGLVQGISRLSRIGPSEHDMYFNYYATQLMHHWQGEEWRAWNRQMRDFLIDSQARDGHEAGSWFFPHSNEELDFGEVVGGRLYFTCLATMTLEVYYRYLPLYREDSVAERF